MDVTKFDTRPQALEIKRIESENKNTRTYVFEYELKSKPGQFVMLWIPGVDEKPFSIAWDNGREFALTICRVGPVTEQLFKYQVGQKLGVRGPFGTAYQFDAGENLALVAGGYGAAPMYFVAQEATEIGCQIEFILGARSEDLLIYTEKISQLDNCNLHLATDDGSRGHKGLVTEVLAEVLDSESVDRVFSCGPERMMKAVGELSEEKNVDCSLSVEKYMKCGFGVCGQCCIDDSGARACVEGPVMNWRQVKNLKEFGNYHRDGQGKKHYF